MMRAAYVCADPGVPVWGNKGCSIHVQGILRGLLRRGVDIDLIALRAGGTCPADLKSIALHLLDVPASDGPRIRERALGETNERVLELLSALGPFDLIYERYALWSYAGMEFGQHQGIPSLLEVNAPLVEEQATHRVLIDRAGASEATERAFQSASMILAVSEEMACHVRRRGIASARVKVVPNGVNPEQFIPHATLVNRENRTFTIGFVGTLKRWHGVDQLVSAYAELWDHGVPCCLSIIGDGPHREALAAQTKSLPKHVASSIRFFGSVPHAEIPALLAKLDAAVVPCAPSGEHYFSPLKLFEYMAAGLPIVAARQGQIPSLIAHGETGLLYDPVHYRNLTNELMRLSSNPAFAARLGEQARHEVFTHHTWDHRCETIWRIVEKSRRQLSVATTAEPASS